MKKPRISFYIPSGRTDSDSVSCVKFPREYRQVRNMAAADLAHRVWFPKCVADLRLSDGKSVTAFQEILLTRLS